MIKVIGKIEKGMRFYLPKELQKLIFEDLDESFPLSEFFIEDIHKVGRRSFVISSSCNQVVKSIRFAMPKHVANYILGTEVEDSNEGYSFNEYIPNLGSEIMVTNQRDLFDIIPGILKLGLGLIEVNGESLRYLFFEFEYFIGKSHTNLSYFFQKNAKYVKKRKSFLIRKLFCFLH